MGIVAGALGAGVVLGALIQELRRAREQPGGTLHLVPYRVRLGPPARRLWSANLARLLRRPR